MGSVSKTEFPPIRACIFDMDGLLINTEDIYTDCTNILLEKVGRPPMLWSFKAKLMGVPGSSTGNTFHEWAQVPIPREQFNKDLKALQYEKFPKCRPLPGVEKLLLDLQAMHNINGDKVHVALASSSDKTNFACKSTSPDTKVIFSVFPQEQRVLGDDPRLKEGRGKPAPDIFLMALQTINDTLAEGEKPITPEECLVFEDSVPGLEAGRRAKMRAVWVPHPELAKIYAAQEKEVLAGRIGLVPIGDEWQLGELDDGWAVRLPSLENFPYSDYGMKSTL
ncbi:HAD-like protein [Mollisia scopiformis]|uniref:HAD-like protein n=1 Tax=Mollisia scopiformis TaxID=149040 RepID=A0A194WWG1_MOLSC|nr:HAD-like protein [Mollisia scopiformis]KUJ11917.1 HAD-like protein [Mollisia scopiformis]